MYSELHCIYELIITHNINLLTLPYICWGLLCQSNVDGEVNGLRTVFHKGNAILVFQLQKSWLNNRYRKLDWVCNRFFLLILWICLIQTIRINCSGYKRQYTVYIISNIHFLNMIQHNNTHMLICIFIQFLLSAYTIC